MTSERLHESRNRSRGRGLVRSSTVPNGPSLRVLVDPSPLSSNVSMEYDDLFELYSEADGNLYKKAALQFSIVRGLKLFYYSEEG